MSELKILYLPIYAMPGEDMTKIAKHVIALGYSFFMYEGQLICVDKDSGVLVFVPDTAWWFESDVA